MAPRKEVEQRACLVPWPERSQGPEEFINIGLTGTMLREEADRFGHEVIDIWWIRQVLNAVATHFEQQDDLITVRDCCMTCGMQHQHVKYCKAIKDGREIREAATSNA